MINYFERDCNSDVYFRGLFTTGDRPSIAYETISDSELTKIISFLGEKAQSLISLGGIERCIMKGRDSDGEAWIQVPQTGFVAYFRYNS